jgi:hypothetical protein
VVIRRPVPEEPSAQLHLFQMGGYSYQVFVTNLSLTPLHLGRFYNQRAGAELIIRELKDAYALGKIPTKDFLANEAFFQIVLLAYNLLNWFKRLCVPAHLQRATLQRLRQRLFLVPSQLVRPGGTPTLRIAPSYPYVSDFVETLRRIRRLRSANGCTHGCDSSLSRANRPTRHPETWRRRFLEPRATPLQRRKN